MTQRCLIVKFGAIGDVVMAIPAAYALHEAGFEVEWLCGVTVQSLLALYPWIKPIAVDDRALLTGGSGARLGALLKLWRAVAGRRYDLCATLNYDWRYRLIALPIRARRKLMLSTANRERHLLPGRHHTDEYARILLGRLDGERSCAMPPVPAAPLPVAPLARHSGRPRVVLVPAGAKNMMRDDGLRRWPLESYVSLAESLLAAGVEVVLIGGPEDGWVVPAFGTLAVGNLIGALALPETLGLLDCSDVLVTHDTGPLHLGGITQVGIVSIFGPTDPRGRLPQRPGTLAIWGGEGFACRPCYDGRDFAACQHNGCMHQVTPAMVAAQVLQMLHERAHGHLAAPRVVTPPSTTAAASEVQAS